MASSLARRCKESELKVPLPSANIMKVDEKKTEKNISQQCWTHWEMKGKTYDIEHFAENYNLHHREVVLCQTTNCCNNVYIRNYCYCHSVLRAVLVKVRLLQELKYQIKSLGNSSAELVGLKSRYCLGTKCLLNKPLETPSVTI